MDVHQKIKKLVNTEYTFTDFFYAYCQAKGIEDPETDLTDEEYTQYEKECEEKLTYSVLAKLGRAMMQDGMERIVALMEEK